MKRILAIVICLLTWSLSNLAQITIDARESAIQQIVEIISENTEQEDLDFSTLLSDLSYFYDHPINLNKADREDLRRLLVLNDFQIEALLQHRKIAGNLMTLEELQGVSGFDLKLIRALQPFVAVSGDFDTRRITWSGLKKEGSHEAFIRYQRVLEEMEGYSPIEDSMLAEHPNRRYVGSPERVFMRYRYRYLDNVSFGVTAEKDAGEEFFGATQPYGFDFYSAHFYLGNRGVLKKFVLGDYQAQFGQGLVFWSGLAFGKFADIRSVKRNPRGITPYVSADENNFLRGSAATLEFGPVEVTGFASYKGVDGNISELDTALGDDQILSFSSFQLTGIHGTPGQLDDKRAIQELNAGGHARYSTDIAQIGLTAVYTDYDIDFAPSDRLYRKFEPTGSPFVTAGFDYQFVYRNIMGFGENALRSDGGTAYINGAILSLDKSMDISLIHRDYSPSFNNPRAAAFGESTRNTNERGLFLGFDADFSRKWSLAGYYDLFQFNWLRYNTDAPTEGSELFLQLNYQPSKRLTAYARYRFEDKEENVAVEDQPTREIGTLHRQWYRLHGEFQINSQWEVRARVEATNVLQPNGEREYGWLVYQDVMWTAPMRRKLKLKVRYAMFDTDGYDSRIYAYEHDVLYGFSVPAYYFRGSRFYVITQVGLSRWSDITIRLAQTYYSNRDSSGSGLNEVAGPTRTELKVQYRISF